MFGKKVKSTIIIIILITILSVIAPVVASSKIESEVVKQVNEEMQTIRPLSKEMVDQAIML